MSEILFLETTDDIQEILRVLRLCHPDFEICPALTFSAGRHDPVANWNHWCKSVFLPHLAPALLTVLEHANRGFYREMLTINETMTLPEIMWEKSVEAGEKLLTGFTVPPGARVLQKLRTQRMPVHFITVYGARCSLFNIPPRLAALAYLYAEWQTGTHWLVAPRHMPNLTSVFQKIKPPASLCEKEPLFFHRNATK